MTGPHVPPADLLCSPEQLRAIQHRGGHLQIVACAGSGKTETVARRVAGLLAEGVTPSAIVAFTFTNAAAASLQSRILRRVEAQLPGYDLGRLARMYVGTIHAYCLRLLQERVPRYATFDLFDDHRVVGLLVREAKALGLDELDGATVVDKVRLFRDTADVVENEMLPATSLPPGPFRKSYERYLELLDRYHVHTHNLCVARAVQCLDDPDTFALHHGALRHLIVDEFQDVNPAQVALIRRLAAAPVEVCAVGDDDQAIYQWRGSSVDFLRGFQAEFSATRETLAVNRRSREGIVRLAADFAEQIHGRVPKEITASRPSIPHDVHRFVCATADDEVAHITTAVGALLAQGVPATDIAVLVRTRATAGMVVEALAGAGIDARCEGRAGLFQQPEAEVLARVFAYIAGEATWQPAKAKAAVDLALDPLVDDLARCFGVPDERRATVGRVVELLRKVVPAMEEADLVTTYHRLLNALGVHQWDPDDRVSSRRLGVLGRFSRVVADYEHVIRRGHRRVTRAGRSLVKAGAAGGEDFVRGLAAYIAYYAHDRYEDFAGEPDAEREGVTVATVHAAKGLEWPVVFVPFLTAHNLPSPYVGKEKRWLLPRELFPAARYEGTAADEERLFYVAMTRAREHLYLSRNERARWPSKPSPFFLRVGGGRIPVSSKALWVPDVVERPAGAAEERPGFAFSDLALYERCPLQLRFARNLGFQSPVVKERGFGQAVHHVLRCLAVRMRGGAARDPEGGRGGAT
jgi:DNA helicase-2/ATP-dependent DNA helicase PcrA